MKLASLRGVATVKPEKRPMADERPMKALADEIADEPMPEACF